MNFQQRLRTLLGVMGFGEATPKPVQSLGKVSNSEHFTQFDGNVTAILNGIDPSHWNKRVSNMLGSVIKIPHDRVPHVMDIFRKTINASLAARGLQISEIASDNTSTRIMNQMIRPPVSFRDAAVHETYAQIIENNGDYSITLHQYIQLQEDNLLITTTHHGVVNQVSSMLSMYHIGQLETMFRLMTGNMHISNERLIRYKDSVALETYLEKVWLEAITANLTGARYNVDQGIIRAWDTYYTNVAVLRAITDDVDKEMQAIMAVRSIVENPALFAAISNAVQVLVFHGQHVALITGTTKAALYELPEAKQEKREAVNA